MTPTHTKKKVSFLSIALGSLIVTSLSTGTAEAKWSAPRCKVQCTKSSVSKSDTKLNDCATNCDNTAIMDILLPNAGKLNADNQKHFQTALKYQQSTIEKQLKAEMAKGKKASESKINNLNEKQDKLIAEINRVGDQATKTEETSKAPPRPTNQPMSTSVRDAFKFMELPETATATEIQTKYKAMALKHHPDKGGDEATFKQLSEANEILKKHLDEQGETVGSKAPERPKSGPRSSRRTSEASSMLSGEEATKAPERPKSGPRPSRPTSKVPSKEAPPRPTSGPHISKPDISQPPSDMPPTYIPPPSDMPPTIEDVHGHQVPAKDSDKNPAPPVKKSGGPVPPPMGQNPRAILKAELLAENPGKKPYEIDAMLKQKLETEHAGKSAGEINQHLKDDQDAKYPGKSHAEILDSLKAGGALPSSGSPTATPTGTGDHLSPQAPRKTSSGGKPQGGSLTDALSGLGDSPQARLKKVDPEALKREKEAAIAEANENPMQKALKEAMAKRRLAFENEKKEDEKKTNPNQDFEQNWDD